MAHVETPAASTAHYVDPSERVVRFVDSASQALASSLDLAETMRTVTRLAVPDFCDLCTLKLVTATDDVVIASVAARTPEMEAAANTIEDEFPLANTGAYGRDPINSKHIGALRTGKPVLCNDVPAAYAYVRKNGLAMHPRMLAQWEASIERLGIKASITQPILAHGRTLGILDFVMCGSGRTFTQGDVDLTSRLAVHAGLALENARLYGEAVAQARSRETFLAVASHELRHPIGALLLQLGLLRQELGTSERVDVLERQARQMSRLVDDLLDVARVGAGSLSLSHAEFDLARLAAEVVGRHAPALARRGQALTLEGPDTLPCHGDRGRVEQVLENLLSNALKYGARRPVTLAVVEAGSQVALTVRDGGPGIPMSARASIFEPFRRAQGAAAAADGAGLGLWIVREIVRALDGTVSVEDAPGGGSAFVVRIPRDARTVASRTP
jgi:signal transduction histidine kinase